MSQYENQVFEFTMTPIKEIFYSNDNNRYFGIYAFSTLTELPECSKYPIMSQSNNEQNNENSEEQQETFEYFSTIKGTMSKLSDGTKYTVKAKLVRNPRARNSQSEWQYELLSGELKVERPNTIDDSKAFLKTILTERQVESLLEVYPNIVELLINDKTFKPDLSQVKGIKEASFEKIKTKIYETYHMADLLVMLQPLGVSFNMIQKLFNDEKDIEILKEKINNNPYEFSKLPGIGFVKIDDFALKINPNLRKSEPRAIACTKYILEEIAENEGNTWIYMSNFLEQIKKIIPECGHEFASFFNKEKELMREGKNQFLFIDERDNRIGLLKYFKQEKQVWELLNKINECDNIYNNVDIEKGIRETNEENGFDLTEEQEQIVYKVRDNNVVILNGNSGTGKTSATKAIIKTFSKYNISICALSARAARRSREVTGLESCKTIHRLLEYNPKEGGFQRNENIPLSEDIIILDEMSMVNVSLYLSLLKAIKPNGKIIFVGDCSQLAPIGAGAVAQDLLESNFTTVKLNKIQRQGLNSGITVDANKIRSGESPLEPEEISARPIVHGVNKDMYYSFKLNPEAINQKVMETFKYLIDTKGISPNDITIIAPMKTSGINSTEPINKMIQEYLLSNEEQKINYGDREFRLGDRVMQLVNDYDKNVVNGEFGYVVEINIGGKYDDYDEDGSTIVKSYDFVVEFPEDNNTKLIKFTKGEMANMCLSYAMTGHKLQGSEVPYVIYVFDTNNHIMLDTTLTYTCITRAKKECYVICNPNAFATAISNNKVKYRLTHLKRLIEKELEDITD